LVTLLGSQFIVIGALDVLFVVLAISVLDLGQPGAGYLNAAFGLGGLLGIGATAALIGRRRLLPSMLIGLGAWALAFGGIAFRGCRAWRGRGWGGSTKAPMYRSWSWRCCAPSP